MPEHPGVAVISALELERDNLSSRLQKVDAAIVAMRELFHLPRQTNGNGHAVRQAKPRKAAAAKSSTKGPSIDALRDALKRGPLSPGDLAAALGMPVARLRYHIGKFEEQGVVRTSGTTASRRVALAESSAKEAP